MNSSKNEDAILSIGGLSKSSGIPVETLRNWERRYGFPSPERLESGHRRYSLKVVKHLRLIREVIDSGYKPSFAVRADASELENIIRETTGKSPSELDLADSDSIEAEVKNLFNFVDTMDTRGMEVALRRAWSKYGASRFITHLAVPFLREVGERWFKGQHTVAHEHFASEVIMSFLAAQWRPLSRKALKTKAVLATLEGELHSLGIHMAAVFLALNDVEVVFLGPNTPIQDILTAASDPRVVAVVVGFAKSSDIDKAKTGLKRLSDKLESEILVAVGGNESLSEIEGVISIEDFEAFEEWAANLKRIAG